MGWLLLCLYLFMFHIPSFNFLCHHDESVALLQFKSSFTYDTMKTATWKNGTDCCSWPGVKCDTDTLSRHVTELNLSYEGLDGILHPNNSIFHLVHLQKLNFSSNSLFGSHFLSKFGEFMNLTHLDLSYCDFQGEVPPQISHLSKLTSLHLSGNSELIWKESTLKRLVQNATNLREMFLDYTDMFSIRLNSVDLLFNHSSSLVTLSLQNTVFGNFKKRIVCLPCIQELYMSGNNLEGELPQFSCSPFLRILDFSFGGFEGRIPLSFSNLTHLTSLSLAQNNLFGSIPSSLLTLPRLTFLNLQYNELSGQVPNVFCKSNKFEELDLSDNNISGELPSSLSNLQHLTHLDLSHNSFSGQIPDVFFMMTKLQQLKLDFNKLKGQIPSSLFNLTQLVTLYCSNNKLEGPLLNKIIGFQKLTYLSLNDNLLNETIPPSLLSLPSLVNLDLSNNQFTGLINDISLYSLQELYLSNNKFQGKVPKSIFNLTNLTTIDLSTNNFSGVVDFQHFSKLPNLDSLSLSYNSQLSLNFESKSNYTFSRLTQLKLSSLGLNEFPISSLNSSSLKYLDLSNNKLKGSVPNWLPKRMYFFGFLNLSQNLLTSIDQISGNSYTHFGLDLSFNLLNGELSPSICNMSSLEFLSMAYNKLTGIIPQCLANSPSLQVLDLQMNKFYGTLPSNFSKDGVLHTLNLYGNQLGDRVPISLSNCRKLEVLNLGSNQIEDNFPYWIQTLQEFKVLILRDNKFHGPIDNIKVKYPFPSLIIFDISGNNFSGPLPKGYLNFFGAMRIATQMEENNIFQYMGTDIVNDTQYYDSVSVETKGNKITLVKIPTVFEIIDFSRNRFEGEIPNVIGELHTLIGLNLSHNRLTGNIPHSMGNLTSLEWLDLSSNILTGIIPSDLTYLNFLEVLDLSNNHLVGEIPKGKQFNTFSNDSYEGNLGLCGLPLSKKCGPEQLSPPSPNQLWSEEKFGFGWKPVAIGYGCGFVFGIGLGYCMFLIGKPRWLVMIFGGQPKRRVKRRTRVRRSNGSTMNQMIQMS